MLAIWLLTCMLFMVLNHTVADDNESYFSKFYQNDYEIKDERVSVASFNKQFIKELSMTTFRYNRTTRLVNGTILTLLDLTEENLLASVQVYKLYGNEYKYFPIRASFNFCHSFNSNLLGIGTFKCGGLACPFKNNVRQSFCNWSTDHSRFPPLMPDGQYLLKVYVISNKENMAVMEYRFTVYRKVKIQ